jgi:hypothetical protein
MGNLQSTVGTQLFVHAIWEEVAWVAMLGSSTSHRLATRMLQPLSSPVVLGLSSLRGKFLIFQASED